MRICAEAASLLRTVSPIYISNRQCRQRGITVCNGMLEERIMVNNRSVLGGVEITGIDTLFTSLQD